MPPRPRSHRALSAALSLANNEHEHHDRPHLDPGEVCVGCIVWLPPKVQFAESIKCNKVNCCGEELDNDGYEHPVVVLSVMQKEGSQIPGDLICTVAFVTTFENTSLHKYLKKRRHRSYFQESIPIFDPAAALLETENIEAVEYLYVENGNLRKQSYVKLQHTYRVPCSSLRQYSLRNSRMRRAYSLRLTEVSYNMLMRKFPMDAQEFIATNQMLPTRDSRLNSLARTPVVHLNPSSTSQLPRPYGPPSPTPYRSALLNGTVPGPSRPQPPPPRVQPLPRIQPAHYPPTPSPATRPPLSNYYDTLPTHYSNSTSYGTISSSIPTYQPPRAPHYTHPEPASNRHGEDGSSLSTIVLVVGIVVGAILYWKYWY